MSQSDDTLVAERFARKCAEARAHLLKEMEAAGLHARDGWKILETVRQVKGGSEIVMRPLHLHKPSPPDLECVVTIDIESTAVDSNCVPEAES